MKAQLIRFSHNFHRRLGISLRDTVFIEGGLGSQILSVMDFWELQEKIGVAKANCNLEYFRMTSPGFNKEELSFWGWKLDSFEIGIESLSQFEAKKNSILIPRPRPGKSDYDAGTNKWMSQRSKYLNRFPINQSELQKFYQSFPAFDYKKKYGAIHIRRGDYLNVASHLISDQQYLDLVSKIVTILPSQLFIFSDSSINDDFKSNLEKILKDEVRAIYVDSDKVNDLVVHAALRQADLLVTSNSTFSFSAALLGKENQIQFSPLKFQRGNESTIFANLAYQSAGNFFLWN
jgi:hypothetical protein